MEGFELDRGRVDPQNSQFRRVPTLRETKKSQRLRDFLIQFNILLPVFFLDIFWGWLLGIWSCFLFFARDPCESRCMCRTQAPFLLVPKRSETISKMLHLLHMVCISWLHFCCICVDMSITGILGQYSARPCEKDQLNI